MNLQEYRELLNKFLERWTVATAEKMTLSDYVDVGKKDTFCYWVEQETQPLGSNVGWDAIKSGIYRRRNKEDRPQNRMNDDEYSWMYKFGNNRDEAFEAVKKEILQVIKFAERGDFTKIENLFLPDFFKWKVAFLYSNERLVPIYSKKDLHAVAEVFGLKAGNHTKVLEIQELMARNKPAGQDIYSYMENLIHRARGGVGNLHEQENDIGIVAKKRLRNRKPSSYKNTDDQIRKGSQPYTATQKHNKLQEALEQKLINEYGDEAVVLLESNYVDVKLVLPDQIIFYEVKSSSFASDCIAEALGQLLTYSFHDKDSRKRKLVVVGNYPPNDDDKKFIEYIKSLIEIDFDYETIQI